MKKILIIMATMFATPLVYADPVSPRPTAISEPIKCNISLVATIQTTPTAIPALMTESGNVTIDNITTTAQEVSAALKAYETAKASGNKLAIRLGLMVLLSTVFKILISLLKFTSDFWGSDKGRLVIRLLTVVLGIGVLVTSKFGLGESWTEAGILALSGPLAISIHELFDVIVSMVQKKPIPPSPTVKEQAA